MNVFQYLAISALLIVIAFEFKGFAMHRAGVLSRVLRIAVWLSASIAIALPDLTTRFAELVGIRRGADLVLYSFVLAFVGSSFYFYSRYVRLQRQITVLVREQAIRDAHHGSNEV